MATLFECDRCQRQFNENFRIVSVKIGTETTVELCQDCIKKLKDWLFTKPAVAQK